MAMTGRKLAQRAARHRSRVASALSISAVVATSICSLVIEDLVPARGQEAATTGLRFAGAVGFVFLTAVLTWLLAQGRRTSGTLYYFRVLAERAPDIHAEARDRAKHRYLDYRTVTRSLRLPPTAWVDVADEVQIARDQLEAAVNTDVTDTSHELAPNAHWPIEFALGYEWPLPDDAELIEFHTKAPGDTRISFTTSASLQRGLSATDYLARQVKVDQTTSLVHVYVHLSGEKPLLAEDLADNVRDALGHSPDITFCWGYGSDATIGLHLDSLALTTTAVDENNAHAAALTTAQAILSALHQHPNATVVVTARIPKCVAVLAGRYFAAYLQQAHPGRQPEGAADHNPEMRAWQERDELYRHWNDPWHRIVMLCRNEAIKRMQAMRVREGQPTEPPPLRALPSEPNLTGELLNLTPHELAVLEGDRRVYGRALDGPPARLEEVRIPAGVFRTESTSIPLIDLRYSERVDHLPDPRPGTWLVVSRVTAQALPHRDDLLFPLDEVRDDQMRIVGCRALGRFATIAAQEAR